MSGKRTQRAQANSANQRGEPSRVLPLAIAGLFCFATAIVLGYGSWYFLGSHAWTNKEPEIGTAASPTPETVIAAPTPTAAAPTIEGTPAATPEQPANSAEKPMPEGVVEVAGGEITMGGGNTKQPLKREIVKAFSISETEVTNAQYAEFIKATDHRAPSDWKDGKFSDGGENLPVTSVAWQDAADFCRWMQQKTGLIVRLPSEAEWELAARGAEGRKFPWGDKWNKDAAKSKETGGKISAVKSFSLNRSPFGAFDMVGNVWEWTADKVELSDQITDEQVREALKKGQILRVVKGGSAQEPARELSAQMRYEIPEKTKNPTVGFRFVVQRPKPQ